MDKNGEVHEVIESTQLLLKERMNADSKLPHGYFIRAKTQTGGRGRGDHSWVSLEGNLHVSILLQELPFPELTWIPHWVGVCVFSALVDSGVDASLIQLKWPNDLWIKKSKKIAGILCEKRGPSVVVGIGLNLSSVPATAPDAGSVSEIFGVLPPEKVLLRILGQFSVETSVQKVREQYEKHALFREGDPVEWRNGDEKCKGQIVGMGDHGELLVKSDGKVASLFVEDVRVVRMDRD